MHRIGELSQQIAYRDPYLCSFGSSQQTKPAQVFQMRFTGDKDSKMQEFRIQNTTSGAYLGADKNRLIQKSTNKSTADIFTFN